MGGIGRWEQVAGGVHISGQEKEGQQKYKTGGATLVVQEKQAQAADSCNRDERRIQAWRTGIRSGGPGSGDKADGHHGQ
ncbi:hypothetical protein GF1_17300 [Desulfolithobacter dissulfuricans]|uniref:Uncharacterized protein n=1 Tax=Desulfolithobacter dissulfuricans TaxID=2795293 RepID=A0A915U1G8_9BACT|nr:hypothetical protein GF1_17300 [Desulfolithobacter dissulfuricans]